MGIVGIYGGVIVVGVLGGMSRSVCGSGRAGNSNFVWSGGDRRINIGRHIVLSKHCVVVVVGIVIVEVEIDLFLCTCKVHILVNISKNGIVFGAVDVWRVGGGGAGVHIGVGRVSGVSFATIRGVGHGRQS